MRRGGIKLYNLPEKGKGQFCPLIVYIWCLLTLRGLFNNLCLTPVRCSNIYSFSGLLVSLVEVMGLNIGPFHNLPILGPSIIFRMGLLISSDQLQNEPTTFPTIIAPHDSIALSGESDHGFVLSISIGESLHSFSLGKPSDEQ